MPLFEHSSPQQPDDTDDTDDTAERPAITAPLAEAAPPAQPTTEASAGPGVFARLTRSKAVLVSLAGVAALAVVGTTAAYATRGETVTLSLDGQDREVTTTGDTVGQVLESEGVEVGEHDLVAPDLDEPSRTAARSRCATAVRSS